MSRCVALLALLFVAAGCGAGAGSVTQASGRQASAISPVPAPPRHWIISLNAIELLKQQLPTPSLVNSAFDNSDTSIIVGAKVAYKLPAEFAAATPVASFTSFADITALGIIGMRTAIENHSLPPGITVAYDDENWQFTATNEISDPVTATASASALAHANNHPFISLPGMDLGTTRTGQKQPLPASYHSFVQRGYLQAARYDDTFELQLENYEMSSGWAALVREARGLVRGIDPKAPFYTQLTSNPNTPTLSSKELLADYHETVGDVDGFALTIPNSAAICPACGQPNVQAMLELLQALYPQA